MNGRVAAELAPAAAVVTLAVAVVAGGVTANLATRPTPPAVAVRFSPGGGCEAAILAELGKATREVRVLAYQFTSEPIAGALIAAHRRGVDVRLVLDDSQRTDHRSQAVALESAGIAVKYDNAHAIMHEKVIIIDGAEVLTGSYNHSYAAEHRNAENLLTLRSAPIARAHLTDWAGHEGHAKAR